MPVMCFSGSPGTHVCHAHEAGNLCRHAEVAEEALVSAPEAAPQDVAAPGGLVVRRASLRKPPVIDCVKPLVSSFLAWACTSYNHILL